MIPATVRGKFLGAELKPWEMNGRSGKTWSVSILQGQDSTRFSVQEDVLQEGKLPSELAEVEIDLEFWRQRDTGHYKPKGVGFRVVGKVPAPS